MKRLSQTYPLLRRVQHARKRKSSLFQSKKRRSISSFPWVFLVLALYFHMNPGRKRNDVNRSMNMNRNMNMNLNVVLGNTIPYPVTVSVYPKTNKTLLLPIQIDQFQEQMSVLRTQGKELHDAGDFLHSAQVFHQVANQLDDAIHAMWLFLEDSLHNHASSNSSSSSSSSSSIITSAAATTTTTSSTTTIASKTTHEYGQEQGQREESICTDPTSTTYDGETHIRQMDQLVEDSATCRLHEALCYLKRKEYQRCIQTCTHVLQDSNKSLDTLRNRTEIETNTDKDADKDTDTMADTDTDTIPLQDAEQKKKDTKEPLIHLQDSDIPTLSTQPESSHDTTATYRTSTIPSHKKFMTLPLSAAVRARALHRRAKAYYALGDATQALEDARSAAFLGDPKAVTFYGRLMREKGSFSSSSNNIMNNQNNNHPDLSFFSPLHNSQDGMDNPSWLLQQFLQSSSLPSSSSSFMSPSHSSPWSMLGDFSHPSTDSPKKRHAPPNGMDTFAKSILSSLLERMEDPQTQQVLCSYLQNIQTYQIQSVATMLGVPLSDSMTSRIHRFVHGLTPRGMEKSFHRIKRIFYVGKILYKMIQVVSKYRHLLVLWALIVWIQSSIRRPIPMVGSKKT